MGNDACLLHFSDLKPLVRTDAGFARRPKVVERSTKCGCQVKKKCEKFNHFRGTRGDLSPTGSLCKQIVRHMHLSGKGGLTIHIVSCHLI